MSDDATHAGPTLLDRALDVAERAAEVSLASGSAALGSAELHIRAWRIGQDPATKAWIDDIDSGRPKAP